LGIGNSLARRGAIVADDEKSRSTEVGGLAKTAAERVAASLLY
jgi:hypothetical protein